MMLEVGSLGHGGGPPDLWRCDHVDKQRLLASGTQGVHTFTESSRKLLVHFMDEETEAQTEMMHSEAHS